MKGTDNQLAIFQVIDGTYNGAKLSRTDQAVLSDNGLDKNNGYSVPLEIKPSGQFEPLYRTTLNVQVCQSLVSARNFLQLMLLIFFPFFSAEKDGELPVLPLSVYGAVAMAHSEVSEDCSSPYQFFFYLYDKRNVSTTQ